MPPSFMASVLDGPEADDMTKALEQDGDLVISAATVAEALIVSRLRGVGKAMAALIAGLGATIAPVALVNAETGADACDRRGKGVYPAGLIFGDCRVYALAKSKSCARLFGGWDFYQTELESVVSS